MEWNEEWGAKMQVQGDMPPCPSAFFLCPQRGISACPRLPQASIRVPGILFGRWGGAAPLPLWFIGWSNSTGVWGHSMKRNEKQKRKWGTPLLAPAVLNWFFRLLDFCLCRWFLLVFSSRLVFSFLLYATSFLSHLRMEWGQSSSHVWYRIAFDSCMQGDGTGWQGHRVRG